TSGRGARGPTGWLRAGRPGSASSATGTASPPAEPMLGATRQPHHLRRRLRRTGRDPAGRPAHRRPPPGQSPRTPLPHRTAANILIRRPARRALPCRRTLGVLRSRLLQGGDAVGGAQGLEGPHAEAEGVVRLLAEFPVAVRGPLR